MMWLVVRSDNTIDWEDTWVLFLLRACAVVFVVGIIGITTCTVYDYRNEIPIKTACRAKGYSWEATNNRCVHITPVVP
jgi:hypothetical protein